MGSTTMHTVGKEKYPQAPGGISNDLVYTIHWMRKQQLGELQLDRCLPWLIKRNNRK